MPTVTVEPAQERAPNLETRIWLRLLGCYNLISAELREHLRDEFGSTLARFDALVQIARLPKGATMGELSRHLMVTKGNITDLIGRLEAEVLVERRRDPGDARVQRVFLTAKGRKEIDAMVPAHARWLQQAMGGVEPARMRELDAALGALRDALRARRRD